VHRPVLVFVAASLLAGACSRPAAPPPAAPKPANALVPARVSLGDSTVSLPKQVGEWARPDAGRRITDKTIFDYMDGAGELYLAYRFDHLDVYEFKPANEAAGTILVELYSMKTPEDAFGLLSNDWGGDPLSPPSQNAPTAAFPPHRALYGGGLLRLSAGPLYARVLASRESPASRDAVLALGRELAAAPAWQPDLPVLALPPEVFPIGSGHFNVEEALHLAPQRTCFFRSHLVLNSQYFLASDDILGLGLDVEAATAEYRPASGSGRLRVFVLHYPSPARAAAALKTFAAAYLPSAARKTAAASAGATKVGEKWVGWSQKSQLLALALDADSDRVALGVPAFLLASASKGKS
jgi:hypothetical protein